jgi:hypothetical protein
MNKTEQHNNIEKQKLHPLLLLILSSSLFFISPEVTANPPVKPTTNNIEARKQNKLNEIIYNKNEQATLEAIFKEQIPNSVRITVSLSKKTATIKTIDNDSKVKIISTPIGIPKPPNQKYLSIGYYDFSNDAEVNPTFLVQNKLRIENVLVLHDLGKVVINKSLFIYRILPSTDGETLISEEMVKEGAQTAIHSVLIPNSVLAQISNLSKNDQSVKIFTAKQAIQIGLVSQDTPDNVYIVLDANSKARSLLKTTSQEKNQLSQIVTLGCLRYSHESIELIYNTIYNSQANTNNLNDEQKQSRLLVKVEK